jgi:hypothetical protein
MLRQGKFHNVQRLMSLNVSGGVEHDLGFLTSVVEQTCSHITYVSSLGVSMRHPRFAGL